MRYEKGHKEATRQRILDVAGRRFRRDGVDTVGLATLMADAGLTHGGFYSHFQSKEDLVGTALAATVEPLLDAMAAVAASQGLEGMVRHYLSTTHRDHPEDGCIAASLGGEMARHPRASRRSFTAYTAQMTALIADHLPAGADHASRMATARGMFALMVGALQSARVVEDQEMSRALLDGAVGAALGLAATLPTANVAAVA